MRKTHIISWTLILIFIIACKKEEESKHSFQELTPHETEAEFSKTKQLKGNHPELKKTLALQSYDVKTIDSLLILKENYKSDFCIYVFNKNTFELITKTGKRGKGPKEITAPGRFFLKKKQNELWLMDNTDFELWKFDLTEAIKRKQDYLPEKSVKLTGNMKRPIMAMESMPEREQIVISGNYGENLLSLYSENGKFMNHLGKKFIKNEEGWDSFEYTKKMSLHFDVQQKTSNIALAYRYFDRVSIVNPQKQTIQITKGERTINKNLTDPKGKHLNYGNIKHLYFRPIWIKNYIVVPYMGKTVKENLQDPKEPPRYPDKLRVFNSEGEPVVQYNLNTQISDICYDRENNRVIALDMRSDNPFIIYKLPILRN
jgi:hypothetical protein